MEVMNLLESAGFSRSNPYYIVQQGKIASLTLMKDFERLNLLKEIGGTLVHEERRHEILKIMQQTEDKRRQIDQVVRFLEERLTELDKEKEEWLKYQQLDKQRKSMEYTIFDKELKDCSAKLDEIEDSRKTVSSKSTNMREKVLEAHKRSKEYVMEYKVLMKEIQGLNKEKDIVEDKRTGALKTHAQIELDLKDIEERISGNARAKEEASRQLKTLKKEIEKTKKELDTITLLHDSKVKEEEEITKCVMDREKELKSLYKKQGRATQFANKTAKDNWLQERVDDLQRVLSSNFTQVKKFQDEINQLKDEDNKLEKHIEGQSVELRRQEELFSKGQDEFNSLRRQRDNLQYMRKSQWNKEGDLTAEIDRLRTELEEAQKSLDRAIPGHQEGTEFRQQNNKSDWY